MGQVEVTKEQRPGPLRMLQALQSHPFRWLLGSSSLAGLGWAMAVLAEGWLVLTITNSAFWVGAAAGARGMGMVVFGLVGGAITDRLDRRRLLLAANLLSGANMAVLAVLILTRQIHLWHVLIIATIEGARVSIWVPATLSTAYDVVGKGRMLNAAAAIAASEVLAMVLGGLLVGTLITNTGLQGSYLFVAGCYFLALLPLLFLRQPRRSNQPSAPLWQDALEGLSYVSRNPSLRSLLLFSILMELFGFSYHVMLPVMARDVLGVGAWGLGYLATAGGMGALVATLVVANLGDFRWKGLLVALGGGLSGIFLVLFALSPYFFLSVGLAVVIGFMFWLYDTNMVTLTQTLASDALRGRLAGLLTVTWGLTPVGGFLAGSIASFLGASFAIGLGGGVIIASTLAIFPRVRRIG